MRDGYIQVNTDKTYSNVFIWGDHVDFFNKSVDFAKAIEMFRSNEDYQSLDHFGDVLDWFEGYAGGKCRTYLSMDMLPSGPDFGFHIVRVNEDTGEERVWFNGGLLFRGDSSAFTAEQADPSRPLFSVSVSEQNEGWSVNT